ncbi:hypothetical protein DFH09DRAFT_1084678 [Mycena vulgaris]|nr:hypothetical protein DFH09DRAFT_1084678 [Mycena vulgaris]
MHGWSQNYLIPMTAPKYWARKKLSRDIRQIGCHARRKLDGSVIWHLRIRGKSKGEEREEIRKRKAGETIFLNPALNLLWSHQTTIVNLLRCMPSDLWDILEGEDEFDALEITLQRPMTSTDWDRASFYRHRVKAFYMDHTIYDADFLETLSLCLPGESIFPKLKMLFWMVVPFHEFHHVRVFLTPWITEIHLGSIATISNLSILSILAVKCPSLTKVTIRVDQVQDSALPMISTFVRGLLYIQSLNVPGVDEAALVHLSQLPDLRSLEVHYPYKQEESSHPGRSLDFPALTAFAAPTMTSATDLVAALSNHPLTSLTIRSNLDCPTHIVARQFYSALAKHCSHSSLRRLTMYGGFLISTDDAMPTPQQISSYSVGRDVLHPLFAFTNLVNVTLIHPVGFDLDDGTVVAMARAWPCLEILGLRARPFRHVRPRVTLDGISAFAKHCRSLRVLAITFDATIVPKLRDNMKKTKQAALVSFDVGNSPIGKKTRRVAKFLVAIFPQLMEIDTLYGDMLNEDGEIDDEVGDPEIKTSHTRWKAVMEALDYYY